MEIVSNDFSTLGNDQLLFIDGGIDWNGIGLGISMTAGGYIGSRVGSIFGPVGGICGGIGGAVVGGIIYSYWD